MDIRLRNTHVINYVDGYVRLPGGCKITALWIDKHLVQHTRRIRLWGG